MIEDMGMEAVGSYLQALRDKRHISRARMADDIGTTENTLWRIESGRQEPGLSLLARMVVYVQGSIDEVVRLASRTDAGIEDGKKAAQQVHTVPLDDNDLAAIARLSYEQRRLILELVSHIHTNSELSQ